ncbi:hypothetical protein IAQ61_004955 [Plenodomus lingam]|uniref:uncharacterized protein n=1 Tax=Leptosphaeria maculans TaxID=5022 RepID=UPI00331BA857|nr:hypothetical protein IAQ61_004955 [Plenodomus lingam]
MVELSYLYPVKNLASDICTQPIDIRRLGAETPCPPATPRSDLRFCSKNLDHNARNREPSRTSPLSSFDFFSTTNLMDPFLDSPLSVQDDREQEDVFDQEGHGHDDTNIKVNDTNMEINEIFPMSPLR